MLKAYYQDIELDIFDVVYEPREDSILLANNLKVSKGDSVLDLCTGTGIQAIIAIKRGAKEAVAVDITDEAVENAKHNVKKLGFEKKITILKSNLFENVPEKKFDVILCNPPYLSEEKEIDNIERSLTGGPEGHEIIEEVLKTAKKYLKEGGKLYLIYSSYTGEKKVKELLKKYKWKAKEIKREHYFFEDIILIEVE